MNMLIDGQTITRLLPMSAMPILKGLDTIAFHIFVKREITFATSSLLSFIPRAFWNGVYIWEKKDALQDKKIFLKEQRTDKGNKNIFDGVASPACVSISLSTISTSTSHSLILIKYISCVKKLEKEQP